MTTPDPVAAPNLPKEPFGYISDNSPFGRIRDPATMTLYFTVFGLAAVGLFVFGLLHRERAGLVAGTTFIAVLWGGVAAVGVYIGLRRLKWKREYERIAGHSPWSNAS